MIRTSTDLTTWTLFEKIRLLELFMNKEILWEGRAEILQNEFAQRPHNFFTVQNIRQELHQIFVTPNPEHVYGLPLHPRGKEAAEMWLKYFRKELTKQRELQKQMFAISMRRHLDLIKRFQQGKLPPQEIEAILTEARERDAQRPDRELYETKLKEMLDKLQLDSLDNIRTFSDYFSYLRGEKIPTPPPEPLEETFPKSPSLVRLKSPLLHSPELVLKEPMTSTKAAQINALEAELIEPTTQPSKQQQSRRRRQKSTSQKTKLSKTQLKIPQQLPAIKTAVLPPPPRNLRSSTAKKIIEEEMEAPIPKTEEEEIKTVAGEELASTVAPIGSRKRKRNVTEFLKPPQTDTNDQQHDEDEGPPAKNLRRSSHSSPSSQTEPKTSTEAKKAPKQPDSAALTPEISSVKEKAEAPVKIEQEQPIVPIKTPPPPPLQLSTPTLHSHVAATAKLRSSLRRAALASATPSPAVDSVGTNGLFLRPGNHSSSEVIPKEVLLTLWKDIRTHRHSYVFDQPVDEGEVPGYHSAIKKPMDLNTLFQLIESFTIQTFGQFTHHILKIFANAVMYNSTGHHVNTCAKEMLAYALKCIEVVQYPSGQWSAGIFSTPIFGTSSNCQSIASESDCPFDGQLSRSSSGISCSQTASTSNAAKTSTQQKLLRSSSTSKRETSKTKAIPSSASSSTSSHSETKKETENDKQTSIVPKNETLPKKRRLHRTR
uniref:Bromo domain-containing protein n=1 Tax=Meloidogyne incognita TaxID=6306 RepID=A0A914MMC1_MELIC